jgi:prolyl oligopeptidase PreP (S9A serine peptidase family)
VPVTRFTEPVMAGLYVPGTRDIVLGVDDGGNERYQLKLVRDDGTDLRELVTDPQFMHILGPVSADGRLIAYASNRRNNVDFDVYVRSLVDGSERCVVETGGWNRAWTFSPDRRWLAALHIGEASTQDSDILLVDLESDETIVCTGHEGVVQNFNPSWYPDSQRFLFSTDRDREFVGIARYDLAGRSWEMVGTPGWDAMAWVAPGGGRALLAMNEDGASRLWLCDAETLERRGPVGLPRPGVVFGSQSTPDPLLSAGGDRVVLTVTTTSDPADAWCHEPQTRSLRRVTRSPSEIPTELEGVPERHRVQAGDGTELPVFLYRPRAAADGAPAPVVLFVHGGPESQFVPVFNPVILHLVDCGFAVVAPNVRGSTGYGKTYTTMDDGRRRLDSVADLGAIHEWLASVGLDPARAALMGGSYGGYMTLAGLAFQPERWAAGVSVVGISSLVTFLENTSPYRRRLRELEYGFLDTDRDFLIEASPLTHVERMRAPLLLIHGSNDPRVPLSEAEQLHAALTERGVECELLVYPDEGHGLAKLANRLDAYPRVSDFLRRVMPGGREAGSR